MDVLKAVLQARGPGSPAVTELLTLLGNVAPLDVHVCSVGGMATTELFAFLDANGFSHNLVSDEDALKHAAAPPATPAARRTIYVFGNLLESVMSHYRRGWAFHQATKTNGGAPLCEATFPKSFDEYVANAVDSFGYKHHVRNWLVRPVQYDILFVRYEMMFSPESAERIIRFLVAGTDRETNTAALLGAFPHKRERQSRVSREHAETPIYRELQLALDRLPDYFVRTAGEIVELEDMA